MSADLASKWIVDGATFNYTAPYEISEWAAERLNYRIPSGDTPGEDGEYQEDSSAEARIITLHGKVMAADGSPDTLRTYLETLIGAHARRTQGKLYRNSDRYILARVVYAEAGVVDGLPANEWEIGFRSGNPFFYDDTETHVSLGSGAGVTAVTPGGSVNTRPRLVLAVTHVGTISITVSGTGQQMILVADATGSYTLDSDAIPEPSALRSTTDVLSQVSGEFVELVPAAQNVTIGLSGGATLSAADIYFRKRYAVG